MITKAGLLLLDDPGFQRKAGQLGDSADLKLSHEAFSVGLHRPMADAELPRDFLVGPSAGDSLEDFTLPGGQLSQASGLGFLLRAKRLAQTAGNRMD